MQLLRQQLQRMTKGNSKARSGQAAPSEGTQRETPLNRVTALATLDELPQEELGKALIRALLTEEFGEAVTNEPKFDQIVSKVHRMIAADAKANRLLGRSLEQLKHSER